MKGILFLAFFMASSLALAHARLKASEVIKIRSTNPGVKTGPCGGYPRVAAPAVVLPGQTLTVSWEETIYHPGRFEFYFSPAGDKNFTLLQTVTNDQKSQPLPHQYSTTVTLPNTTCNECTLQMIQVMAENPSNPTYYYSCADLQVKAPVSTQTPTPTPIFTPTPTPTPSSTPPPVPLEDCSL